MRRGQFTKMKEDGVRVSTNSIEGLFRKDEEVGILPPFWFVQESNAEKRVGGSGF